VSEWVSECPSGSGQLQLSSPAGRKQHVWGHPPPLSRSAAKFYVNYAEGPTHLRCDSGSKKLQNQRVIHAEKNMLRQQFGSRGVKHWRVVWRAVVPPWRMNHACWTCLCSFCRRYALYRVSVILVTTTNIIREDVATNSDWLWRSSVQQSNMLTTYCV